MGKGESRWEAVGIALFGAALRLLPDWLRRRTGAALAGLFAERQRERLKRWGPGGLPTLWAREFGGVLLAAVTARDGGRPALGSVARDLSMGVRALTRRPWVMVFAVVTLGLGVGASTAMYSVVDTLLLRPLPHPHAERLVRIYPTLPAWREIPSLADEWRRGRFSGLEWVEVRQEQTSFEAMGAVRDARVTVTSDDRPPAELSAVQVTPGTLELFVARPLLGRTFTEEDLGGPEVVVLSHALWTERYGADPGIVGSSIRLTDRPRTVIGVLPAGASLPGRTPAAYLPLDLSRARRDDHSMDGFGRLREGVDLARAEAEVTGIVVGHLPDDHTRHTAYILPVQEDATHAVRTPVLLLLGGSLLLLLVALASTAAMLLGTGIDRQGELAVRRTLGAGRGRLVRQLLTESLVLGALGAALGAVLATAGVRMLVHLTPPGFPGLDRVAVDGPILALAVALAVAGALLAGLLPAVSLTRRDLRDVTAGARFGSSLTRRLQSAVVVAEIALATALVGSGALLMRSLLSLNALDAGFAAEQVLVADLSTSLRYQRLAQVDAEGAFDELKAYVAEVQEALASLPGALSVAATTDVPLGGSRGDNEVWPVDREVPEAERPLANRRAVTGPYFETLSVPLLEGRTLSAADDHPDAEPVTVISQGLAQVLWPGGSAVGRSMGLWAGEFRVVGVVANLRDETLTQESEAAFYLPMSHIGSIPTSFVIRSAGPPEELIPAVRARIWSVDADVPIRDLRPLTAYRSDAVAQERFRARLILTFAALATLFSLAGVYGVARRSVSRRRRELGIRLALGAGRARVHGLVLRQATVLAFTAVALGLAGSLAAGRLFASLLFGVSPGDPTTLLPVAALMVAATLAASLGPARTATRVEPVEALRAE